MVLNQLEYDFGPKEYFIVMEYLSGVNPTEYRRRKKGRLIPPDEAVRIIGRVALAIHSAHRKRVIHKDIKPENLVIMPKGGCQENRFWSWHAGGDTVRKGVMRQL